MAEPINHTHKTNGYNQHNNNNDNNDNNDKNDKQIEDILELGLLSHHEIENFFMEEEKIEQTAHPISWSNCDATTFNVRRGPDYTPGKKSPSKKALYTAFAMDAYKTPIKLNKIFKYMNLDKYIKKYSVPYDKKKFPLPALFILNVLVPNYAPELMGGKNDGEGYHIILYSHLSNELRSELMKYSSNPNKVKLKPAVKLLSNFIHSDLVNSEIRNRFKVIARVMNSQYTDFGFLANRLVKRYNGKPFLARTSSTFYHEPGKYFAADIDAHLFGYPARQGLSYVKNSIQTAVYDVGLVIEGHENNELPEQILACCRVSKMGVNLCKTFPNKYMKLYKQEKHNKHNNDEQKSSSKSTTNLINDNNPQQPHTNNNNNKPQQPHRNGLQSKSTPSLPNTSSNDKQSGNSNQQQKNQQSLTSKIMAGWGYFG